MSSHVFLDVLGSALVFIGIPILIFYFIYSPNISRSSGYILRNQVVHARLLPAESKHAFIYRTACLLISLKALEAHQLDCGFLGSIFSYDGRWGHILGIRAKPYLVQHNEPTSIMQKLHFVLDEHGFKADQVDDAWMMTMPSILGFEGINPLTVYFCYDDADQFVLTVLEIHNTFGESHVHILKPGIMEDGDTTFDHQWTFRRKFHVSPFNDRSGFYTVSINEPSHAPSKFTSKDRLPLPCVRVHLHTLSETEPNSPGPLKLTALLRPTSCVPLTTPNILILLIQTPFALFLSFARIAYQAWILHYQKRLDVHLRPEPFSTRVTQAEVAAGGGVKWIEEGLLEKFARRQVEAFLERTKPKVAVILVAGDPLIPQKVFGAPKGTETLTISYLSARFFTILLLAPSAAHALLLGCDTEGIFETSSRDLFLEIFTINHETITESYSQKLRRSRMPSSLQIDIPPFHFLDFNGSSFTMPMVISLNLFIERVEKFVFSAVKARVYTGEEPWFGWERAEQRWLRDKQTVQG